MDLLHVKSTLGYFWCRLQRWRWGETGVPAAVFNSGPSVGSTQLFCFHWCTWHVDVLLLEMCFWLSGLSTAVETEMNICPSWGSPQTVAFWQLLRGENGRKKLQTCPVSFSPKPLLPVSVRNRFLSCIWLYGGILRSRINVGQVFGTDWNQERIGNQAGLNSDQKHK